MTTETPDSGLSPESGDEVRLVAGGPLDVMGAGDAFVVSSGRAIVFAQKQKSNTAVGARLHLGTFAAGEVFFGLGEDDVDVAIEVSADPETSIRRVSTSSLEESQVSTFLARWLARILSPPRGGPRGEAALLVAGKTTSLPAGASATSESVSWIRPSPQLKIAVSGVSISTAEELFPVCNGVTVSSGEDVEVPSKTTTEVISDLGASSAISLAVTAVRGTLVSRCTRAGDEFMEQLSLRSRIQASERDVVLESLKGTVEIKKRMLAVGASGDQLIDACRLVAQATGVNVPNKLTVQADSWIPPIDQICRIGRFRSRIVVLEGTWWKKENGPILAIDHDGNPVALLWKRGKYKAFVFTGDPIPKKPAVDEAFAKTLEDRAWTFYRPMPPKKVGLFSLLAFAARGCYGDFGVIIGVALVVSLLNLVPPYAIGTLIDTVIPQAGGNSLFILILVLAVAAFATTFLSTAQSFVSLRAETRGSYNTLAAMLDRVISLPATFFRQYSAGDLSQRIMGIETIRRAATQTMITTLFSGVSALGYLILIIWYSWTLAFWALGLALIPVVLIWITAGIQVHYQHRIQASKGRLDALLLQLFTGIEKIRVSAAENRMFARWGVEFAALRSDRFCAGIASGVLGSFTSTYAIVTTMIIFWVYMRNQVEGSAVNIIGSVSTGEFLAFNAAFTALLASLSSVGTAIMPAMMAVPIYQRLKPALQSIPEDAEEKAEAGPLKGHVEARALKFSYDAEQQAVLHDVSIMAEPGEFIAIVGPSGSGKSTLLKLLLGIEKPSNGQVFYDERDLSRFDASSVRQQIGTVMQDTRIMPGFLLETLIGNSNLTVDNAWEAVKLAGIEDEIKKMPMGMYTYISDATISGGQRQRILIARALVTKPKFLFFDEATSALDRETQSFVTKSLSRLKVTRIVIAHRLSTIRSADRIYVLDDGRIAQHGTYDELIGTEGRFKELVKRQMV